jgi:hypothetical protein
VIPHLIVIRSEITGEKDTHCSSYAGDESAFAEHRCRDLLGRLLLPDRSITLSVRYRRHPQLLSIAAAPKLAPTPPPR